MRLNFIYKYFLGGLKKQDKPDQYIPKEHLDWVVVL